MWYLMRKCHSMNLPHMPLAGKLASRGNNRRNLEPLKEPMSHSWPWNYLFRHHGYFSKSWICIDIHYWDFQEFWQHQIHSFRFSSGLIFSILIFQCCIHQHNNTVSTWKSKLYIKIGIPVPFFLILNICDLYCHWIGNEWKKIYFLVCCLSEIITNHAEDIDPWDFYDHSNIKIKTKICVRKVLLTVFYLSDYDSLIYFPKFNTSTFGWQIEQNEM